MQYVAVQEDSDPQGISQHSFLIPRVIRCRCQRLSCRRTPYCPAILRFCQNYQHQVTFNRSHTPDHPLEPATNGLFTECTLRWTTCLPNQLERPIPGSGIGLSIPLNRPEPFEHGQPLGDSQQLRQTLARLKPGDARRARSGAAGGPAVCRLRDGVKLVTNELGRATAAIAGGQFSDRHAGKREHSDVVILSYPIDGGLLGALTHDPADDLFANA
jgi:hypothetical protein